MILEALDRYLDWRPGKRVAPTGWTKVRCPNPDHEDSVDSATVSIEFEHAKCFACGWSRSAIQIVMEEEEVSRDDAIDILAELDPVGASAFLSRPATRKPGRRVFGDGTRSEPRSNRTVRSRVFRGD